MDIKFLKKLRNTFKYKIWSYFWYRSPIYISLNPFRIFDYWWQCRDIFIKPVIVKHKLDRGDSLYSDYFYLNTDVHNKWLHIKFQPCDWKSKYDEVRFESVPYILVVIKNKAWVWGFEAPLYEQSSNNNWIRNNMLYWEGILSYLIEHNKDLIKTYKNNIWTRHYNVQNLSDGSHHPLAIQDTIFHALTEKGKRIILEYQMKKNKNKDEESS